MKWINAEQLVTVTIYDEEHEEHHDKTMTVEEMLDAYTNEGCPTMYINPERKGKWIKISPAGIYECSECGQNVMTSDIDVYRWCHGCGAKMEEGEHE